MPNGSVNHADIMNPNKNWSLRLRGAPWMMNTLMCWEGGMPEFHKHFTGSGHGSSPRRLQLKGLFIWLILICTLSNKTVLISIVLS